MFEFNKKEQKEIKSAFNIIIEEIKEMFTLSDAHSLTIKCPSIEGLSDDKQYDDDFYIEISNKQIYLCNKYRYGSEWNPVDLCRLIRDYKYPFNYNTAARIIKIYPELKENIIAETKKSSDSKEDLFKYVKRITEDHFSTVELDLPESLNRHQIEITHEDDSTIGTINFGSQTVKIITRGDIVLVDADKEHNYQKKKVRK